MRTTFEFGCVYFFKSKENILLYIGKTYSLKNRLSQHLSDLNDWKKDIYCIDYLVLENEVDRDIIETYCINLHKPLYNKDKVFNETKPTIHIELPIVESVLASVVLKTINKRNNLGNFKDCCLEYIINLESREVILEIYPLIKEAYELLGEKKMKALEFVQKDIQKELVTRKILRDSESQIVALLNYKVGQLLDKAEVKQEIQKIYNALKIEKVAKASDLCQWYTVKNHNKMVAGKTITKLKVISCNTKIS